ncbi:phosphotransferase [Sulfurospirillum arcachonense]|uniref:phosphotransferase n=1 Tax=Sulfurospirillum arcachonense TaxID=57666 RepID=UPI00046A0F50|nr:phosphotransferase [Sulfurospirillum arcachonense]
MSVKTQISKKEISSFFEVQKLECSSDGHSDSVYFLDDKYILKLFEKASEKSIKEEMNLLEMIRSLSVPRVKTELFYLKEKPALIYTKQKGQSPQKPTLKQVEQIALFLKCFHGFTKGKTNRNEKLFDKQRVWTLVKNSKDTRLIEAYESLEIDLKNDGIIHGDIFLDNVVFKEDVLSGVFDFIDACEGDFILELAVVAFSWNLDEKGLNVLLSTYGANIDSKEFKKYIKYALICYCSFRAAVKRDYEDIIIGL